MLVSSINMTNMMVETRAISPDSPVVTSRGAT